MDCWKYMYALGKIDRQMYPYLVEQTTPLDFRNFVNNFAKVLYAQMHNPCKQTIYQKQPWNLSTLKQQVKNKVQDIIGQKFNNDLLIWKELLLFLLCNCIIIAPPAIITTLVPFKWSSGFHQVWDISKWMKKISIEDISLRTLNMTLMKSYSVYT